MARGRGGVEKKRVWGSQGVGERGCGGQGVWGTGGVEVQHTEESVVHCTLKIEKCI